jgi:hypothetical protein
MTNAAPANIAAARGSHLRLLDGSVLPSPRSYRKLAGAWGKQARVDKRAPIPPARHRGNRRPCKFTQRDISRAIRGVEATGKQVGSIRIGTDGSIQVAIADPNAPDDGDPNEWND